MNYHTPPATTPVTTPVTTFISFKVPSIVNSPSLPSLRLSYDLIENRWIIVSNDPPKVNSAAAIRFFSSLQQVFDQ